MNTADFIAMNCATFVRTSPRLRGGITGAMRIAHPDDAFRLRAEVHGDGLLNRHLCMAISNTTYYESLIKTNPVVRPAEIDSKGLVHAPTAIGVGYEAGNHY
jgi:L-alanine-DL-glutamate epimerase-like enolase superfamily enzyme